MKWYQIFSIISGTLILIAVFILAFKMINAGMNTTRKNEVKENCLRETEELLSRAIEKGKCSGITYQEMQDMLSLIMEDIYDSH